MNYTYNVESRCLAHTSKFDFAMHNAFLYRKSIGILSKLYICKYEKYNTYMLA